MSNAIPDYYWQAAFQGCGILCFSRRIIPNWKP